MDIMTFKSSNEVQNESSKVFLLPDIQWEINI